MTEYELVLCPHVDCVCQHQRCPAVRVTPHNSTNHALQHITLMSNIHYYYYHHHPCCSWKATCMANL